MSDMQGGMKQLGKRLNDEFDPFRGRGGIIA